MHSQRNHAVHALAVCAALAISLLMGPYTALADDWDGSDSSDWDDDANWVDGTAPISGDDVFVDTTAGDPPFDPIIDSTTDIANTDLGTGNLIVGSTNGSDANLTIEDGATFTSEFGNMGFQAGSSGTVLVTGTGSQWTNTAHLYLGNSGTGDLTVEDGGVVSAQISYIGRYSGSSGTALVTGTGSQFDMSSSLFVGLNGTGDLTISDGGTVNSAAGYLGRYSTGYGTVTVDGADSLWSVIQDLSVGRAGTADLTVSSGGSADVGGTAYVGVEGGGQGTLTVTGAGSQFLLGGLELGWYGTGELTIADGGDLEIGSGTGTTIVGRYAGSSGTLNIGAASGDTAVAPGTLSAGNVTFGAGTGALVFNHTDTSETYAFAPDLISGSGTSAIDHYSGFTRLTGDGSGFTGDTTVNGGTLQIENMFGGSNGYIGYGASDDGAVIVTGPLTAWTLSDDLYVGSLGTGELTVENGGALTSDLSFIGNSSGSSGSALVTGAGSEWTSTGTFYVGYYGTGDLTVSDGGSMQSTYSYVGRELDAIGTALVTGTDSEWLASTELFVGFVGTGDLTVSDGGYVQSGVSSYLGYNSGSSGAALVTGTDSEWETTGNLYVGLSGDGELTIADGGVVNNTNTTLGQNSGSSGSVLVTGAGSQLYSNGNLTVGISGDGEVRVEDGGTVVSGFSLIGSGLGGSGTFTVTGAGSQWSNSGLFLGNGSQGVLTISDGGIVNVTSGGGTIDIAVQDVGILNIGSSSVDAATAPGELQAGLLNFGSGTGTLVFNHTDTTGTYAFAPNLASGFGTSAIDHYAGYTQLTGDGSGFDGTTTIYGGTLAVENMLGGTVDVMDGGTLGGSGDILGTINVGDGAILAPGSSIGTLDVVGDVVQGGGSTLLVEVDDVGNGDLLNITGSYAIDAGATLHATPENGTDDGSTYAASTQYTVVTASTGVSGTFDTVTDDFFFLEALVDYDANNVYLTLEQIFDFVDAAITPNQMQTAGGLDALADGDPLKDAMLMILSEEDAQDAFGQLSGEIHPSLRGALRANDGRAVGAALNRLDDPTEGPGDIFWATGFGNWSTTDAAPNTHELGNDAYGLVAGVDRAMGDAMRLGLMGAYSRTDASVGALRSDADTDSYSLGIYGGADEGRFVLDFGALYSWHNVDTTRRVTNPLTETLTASYNARSVQLFGEAGFRIGANQVTATPFAGLAYGNVDTDGFSEQGGDAALTAASESLSTTFATLGVRPEIELGPNMRTSGMIGWRRALGDLDTDTTFSFDGINSFNVTGAPLAEDSVVGEFGFDMFTAGGINIGASYVGQYGDGVASNGFDLRLSTTF